MTRRDDVDDVADWPLIIIVLWWCLAMHGGAACDVDDCDIGPTPPPPGSLGAPLKAESVSTALKGALAHVAGAAICGCCCAAEASCRPGTMTGRHLSV